MKRYLPKTPPYEDCSIVPTYTEKQVQEGRTMRSVFEEIDPIKVNEGISAYDLSLSVLIENNATDLLKPLGTIAIDPLSLGDQLNDILENATN